MISVCNKENGGIVTLTLAGHSGIKGESLVCAGVSTLFAALSISLENILFYEASSGNGVLKFPATAYNKANFSMFNKGIRLLENCYPEEIKILNS